MDIVRPKLSTVVHDRRGGLLAEIGPEARSWVRMVELPAYVGQAFVATEDRRFYQHDGVDVIGLVGAIRDNLLRGFGSRGASTITQQLIGAMYPAEVDRREITIGRKLREAEMARALERGHTKAEILEAYLNYIPFGHGWYGVEAAARHYFGKYAASLTVAEAALLAALPKSPVRYDPRAHPGRARCVCGAPTGPRRHRTRPRPVSWSGSARGRNRHRRPPPPACCTACAAGWCAGGRPGRDR